MSKPCPAATQSVALNTDNRQHAIDQFMYGPPNPLRPELRSTRDFWQAIAQVWSRSEGYRLTPSEAQTMLCGNCAAFDISIAMRKCIGTIAHEAGGEVGYCHAHHFKCAATRTCMTWVAGGPIT